MGLYFSVVLIMAYSTATFVTAKVIGMKEGQVLASYDYDLPLGPDTKHLLKTGAN